ncbi:MAG: PglZ domain-containing protein, partial [Candidatus Latescibacteria bacterium]|nr:PglZ domain-containing protein [Candidatus Latescibacterota bacterium]
EIKQLDPDLPVVMITKSQEEHIMDDAIGSKISDYLIKPVNPSQIYTTLKRLLDSKQLRSERISRDYARQANQNRMELAMGLDHTGWAQIYTSLSKWNIELDEFNDPGLEQIHSDQKKEFRREFSKYVEKNYRSWIEGNGPVLSHKLLDKYVAPLLKNNEKVYYIVIDCFRLDHWIAIEPLLDTMFHVERNIYYSLLPTATPFGRNSLFAGLLPSEIANIFPDIWHSKDDNESGMNLYEPDLLEMYLTRAGIRLGQKPHYVKILTTEHARSFLKKITSLKENRLVSIVYNFIDLLSHQMAKNDILQEIAPDEAAFRNLTKTWFNHSVLLEILQAIADEGATVVITSDHGSITGERASIVRGDRTTSTTVRYKYGKNLRCEPSEVFFVGEPLEYGLPSLGFGTNYLFAKDDYYLIYKNKFREFEKLYNNTLQHGGISMEEMILPVGILRPR